MYRHTFNTTVDTPSAGERDLKRHSGRKSRKRALYVLGPNTKEQTLEFLTQAKPARILPLYLKAQIKVIAVAEFTLTKPMIPK